MESYAQDKRIDLLAREVLLLSRNTLLVHLRFLDTALSRFAYEKIEQGYLATDGQTIQFAPKSVLRAYRDEREKLTRDYLHMVLHCVFRHAFVDPRLNRDCWDLACDIAVECAIDSLELPCVAVKRQERQAATLNRLNQDGVLLTAEKIYRYYMDQSKNAIQLTQLREAFLADDHDLWYPPQPADSEEDYQAGEDSDQQASGGDSGQSGGQAEEEPGDATPQPDTRQQQAEAAQANPEPDESDAPEDGDMGSRDEPGDAESEPEDDQTSQAQDEQQPVGEEESSDRRGRERDRDWTEPDQPPDDAGEAPGLSAAGEGDGVGMRQAGGGSSTPASQEPLTKEELDEIWSDIARHMKVDMETGRQQRGTGAGAMMQSLKAVTREQYDYSTFLRQFAVLGENIQINDDEFDYIYYTYGLRLYGSHPLIEPLEYKEVKRIKEFVIAIDTSGSVKGEEVQRFIQKTYNILLEEESFFTKINLHIVQCDAAIQEVQKITSREEFDSYLSTMTLKGFGGTDFRPVFAYVDRMLQEHEFTNLKGLIYFTDGEGIYPQQQPNYDTAFVFVRDDYEAPKVPVWAIRLILDTTSL